jgi:threonine synthase
LSGLRYISTRGRAPALGFADVLVDGLARDGGLYLPESWPRLDLAGLAKLDYAALAHRVMYPFVWPDIDEAAFANLVRDAYAGFDHDEVAPLTDLGADEHLLELVHGPTLAFKDYALQLVGRLLDHVLAGRGRRATILGATSGDTGSAAIAACRDRPAMTVVILHPKGRVSDVQRRQMTTVDAPNVFNVAIEGSFDDCQDLVKAAFNDTALRDRLALSAVNSINWARVLAQIVYYVWAALKLGAPSRAIAFAVPTGNFGNVYAGYAARAIGLPIAQLIVGANRNDILARFFAANDMSIRPVEPSLSPSMDIQVSSNFERLLFDLLDRSGAAVTAAIAAFRATGRLALPEPAWRRARALFDSARFSDEETLAVIRSFHAETGRLIDPHTAIGLAAGRARRKDAATALVVLETAHPAKFPDAVRRATGVAPALPERLADLMSREEHCTVLPNDKAALAAFLLERVGGGA